MDLIKEGHLIKFVKLNLFDVSVEFMENYIYESDQKKVILQNIADLYVLSLMGDNPVNVGLLKSDCGHFFNSSL